MKKLFFRFIGGATIALLSAIFIFGCDSKNSDSNENDDSTTMSGIEINATASYIAKDDITGMTINVWTEGYINPITNAVVTVNGSTLEYNETNRYYTFTTDEIKPGDDIVFSITCDDKTFTKTITMPAQVDITGWDYIGSIDPNVNNTVSWTYPENAPGKFSILIGSGDWKDISGSDASYVIPANTLFTGTEAYAYFGIRAVNFYEEDDKRISFTVFTSNEGFNNFKK